MKYKALIDGELIEIEMNRTIGDAFEVEIRGRTYVLEARMVEPGVYWMKWGNRSLEVAVTEKGDAYVVSLPEIRVAVEMVDSRTALRRAAQHGHDGVAEIRAPMPGKVVRLLVGEGGEVQTNQGLLVMEAMKMQNEIKSPKKGIVRKLAVAEGTAVSSGDLLAVVD